MDELLTVKEVAEYLKVDIYTVRRYIKQGDLTATVLPGGDYRITRSNLTKVLTPYIPTQLEP